MRHSLDGNAITADAHYDQFDGIGHEDEETCNRVDPPYEDPRRNWRTKPCNGVMNLDERDGMICCNTCGDIGD